MGNRRWAMGKAAHSLLLATHCLAPIVERPYDQYINNYYNLRVFPVFVGMYV
jgi:hypothetical protein